MRTIDLHRVRSSASYARADEFAITTRCPATTFCCHSLRIVQQCLRFYVFKFRRWGQKTNKSVPQKLFYVGWHSTVIRLAQLCRTDVSWWRPGWSPFFLPFCYFLFWWLSSLSRSKILCAARHDTSSYRRWVARPVRARSAPTGNYPGSPIRYLATFDVKSGSIILFF